MRVKVEVDNEKKGGKKISEDALNIASLDCRHSFPRTKTRTTLTLSEAGDVAEEDETLEAFAVTLAARDAKEAIIEEEGTDDAADNAGEEKRREREAAAPPPPIRLSAIAVARSMVVLVEVVRLEERETRRCWRWSIVKKEEQGERSIKQRASNRGRKEVGLMKKKLLSLFPETLLLLSLLLLSPPSF